MADESVTEAGPERFLELNANYNIAPDASTKDLIEDAFIFLSNAQATVETLAVTLHEEGGEIAANSRLAAGALWGTHHQLEMAHNVLSAICRQLNEEETRHAN